jgi:hypothetical protein
MFQWFLHLCKPTVAIDDTRFCLASSLLKTLTTHSEDLEIITHRSINLSLSPEGADSGVVFRGMTHNGSPSLHTILEKSPSEDDSVSSEGESFVSPLPRACNTVMSATPITTTLPLKETPMF